MFKKIGKKTYLSLSILVIILLFSIIYISLNQIVSKSTDNLSASLSAYENSQTYITENGEKRTILWLKGVDAPKMLSKGEIEDINKRVFRKSVDIAGGQKYIEYNYPIESNRGYYDLNKNPERLDLFPQQVAHHCYLAAGMNQLFWWLDQNKYYVDKYLDYIKQGIFGQYPGLRAIDDMDMWNRILTAPIVQYTIPNDYYSMQLSDSAMYKEIFKVYHDRDLGYYSDLVWDYFFNGYFHYHPQDDGTVAPPNSTSLWQPDPNGGLFYNLLNKEKISTRQGIGTYEMFSEVIKNAILSNKGIVLDYLSVGTAHAITLWGAEFDEKGNIMRVYLTDSDDYNDTDVVENKHIVGLYSNDIVKDNLGNARLTTRADRNPNSGSIIHEVNLLSLAQDRLEAALNDVSGPITPTFELNLVDQAYSSTEDIPRVLEVKVKREDKGDYLYKWYKAEDNFSKGILLKNEKKSWITPQIPQDNSGAIYYYCEITNIKNGIAATAISNRAKIYIDVNVKHAAKPTIEYDYGTKNSYGYKQYEKPLPIKVFANTLDTGVISYQWYHSLNRGAYDGELLPGETNNVFYPNNVADWEPDVGGTVKSHFYYCVATNTNKNVNGLTTASTTTSRTIEIFVKQEAEFLQAIEPVILKDLPTEIEEDVFGKLSALEVGAKSLDHGNLLYQWYFANDMFENGTPITNATKNVYTPLSLDKDKYYYCEITNFNNKAINSSSNKVYTSRTKVKGNGNAVSNDNNLYNLVVSHGELSPSFESDKTNYTLKLASNENSTNISASYAPTSQVVGLGSFNLAPGETRILKIIVTAQSGAKKEYTINVTRQAQSNINKLSGLKIQGVALLPEFDSDIYEYTATVGNNVSKVDIVPTLLDNKSTFKITGNTNSLNVGLNKITIVVTAEDGSIQNYIVNITRKNIETNPEPEIPNPETPEPETPQPDVNDKDNNFKGNTVWIILGLVLLVLTIIIMLIVFLK